MCVISIWLEMIYSYLLPIKFHLLYMGAEPEQLKQEVGYIETGCGSNMDTFVRWSIIYINS
jgi:hypothetical protein